MIPGSTSQVIRENRDFHRLIDTGETVEFPSYGNRIFNDSDIVMDSIFDIALYSRNFSIRRVNSFSSSFVFVKCVKPCCREGE